MECFRIDESGYTGFDLLNRDQRFQGAAAIAIKDEEAARLIKEFFPRSQAGELKYRALSRRPGNHPRLLALLAELLRAHKSVTYVCDKRFLLILMFCDYAVEPWYFERGCNFYEDGQNYGMASLLATAGPTLLGKPEFEAMLATFQRAVKDKTPAALKGHPQHDAAALLDDLERSVAGPRLHCCHGSPSLGILGLWSHYSVSRLRDLIGDVTEGTPWHVTGATLPRGDRLGQSGGHDADPRDA